MRHWILTDERPPRELEVDWETWAEWFEEWQWRVIAQTQIKNGPWVSTIFMGLDMSHGRAPEPLLYETAVFGPTTEEHRSSGPDLDGKRSSTYDEALRTHEALVERWAEGATR